MLKKMILHSKLKNIEKKLNKTIYEYNELLSLIKSGISIDDDPIYHDEIKKNCNKLIEIQNNIIK